MRLTLAAVAMLSLLPAACHRAAEPSQSAPPKTELGAPAVASPPPSDSAIPSDTVTVLLSADISDADDPRGPDIVSVDAIAFLRDSTFLEVPVGEMGDSAADAFRATWYARSLRYRLFTNGVEVGTLDSLHAEEPGCSGLDATARWRPLPSRSPGHSIATNLRRLRTRPLLGPAALADQTWLSSFAKHVLADSGLKAGTLPDQMITSVPLDSAGGIALLGVFAASQREPFTFQNETQDVEFVYALVLVAERTTSGLQPHVLLYAKGAEADAVSWELYDALDLIGDHTPEIILRARYYESTDYLVFARGQGGWLRVYRGGGGGC
jgi:hypothetical protein